ncbi:hypothetical protein Vadar_022167 [Vaccinium darrowii]|uniref:Uncharacterized protein n=1 Tax=Vaccinium darrowii TaxID=229202 RepID=A0ACB7Y1S1_9ERIC|nr:hypothetical protein Vadar_022167 [Vaccinium darrowii]
MSTGGNSCDESGALDGTTEGVVKDDYWSPNGAAAVTISLLRSYLHDFSLLWLIMSESLAGSNAQSISSDDDFDPSSQLENGNPIPSSGENDDKDPDARLRSKYWKHYNRVKIMGVFKAVCKKALASVVIMHEYPLSIVEHVGFRRYSHALQPLFKVPCRNTLKSDIFKIYEYEKGKTLSLVASNASRLAVTIDMWTSSNQKKGFMAVTAHFIDDSWTLQSRILRFIYVPCPHTKEVLSVLDPRYKIKVMQFYFAKLFGGDYEVEVENIRAFCYKLVKEYRSPSSMMEGTGDFSSQSSPMEVESLSDWLWVEEMKGEPSRGYATIYDDVESEDSCVTRVIEVGNEAVKLELDCDGSWF